MSILNITLVGHLDYSRYLSELSPTRILCNLLVKPQWRKVLEGGNFSVFTSLK